MDPRQLRRYARQYAMEYDISERQATVLVANALGQDPSGRVLVFALALLAQQVDVETITRAMVFGETAWYRSAQLAL